jgi:Domain of unknown function (DUF5666)/Putative binding domain, N-terminal
MTRALRILTAVIAIAASSACGSTSSNTVAGPSPAKCELTATNSTPNFTASGGQGAIAVLAARECVWTAAAQVGWVALMPPMEGQGEATLKYNVQTNPSGVPRRGTINVAGQMVEVAQAGAQCRFDLDRSRAQIAAGVTSIDVNVQGPTGCPWTAATDADWLSVTQGAQGNGPGRVTVRAIANPGAGRVGTVLIAGVRFEVTQVAASDAQPPPPAGCSYSLQPASAQLDASATEGSVALIAGGACPWNAASDQPWLSLLSAASGSGDARIAYRVAANDTGKSRTAQITVGTAVFTVQQAAAGVPPPSPCTFEVDPDKPITAAATGDAGTLAVTTTGACTWTAAASAGWIQLTTTGSTGPGSVGYTITPNGSTSERTGTITLAGTTVSVTQTGVELEPITLRGAVNGLTGTCPTVTFTVEGRTVSTSDSTNFKGGNCAKLENGETVSVRGLPTLEGTVNATEIDLH